MANTSASLPPDLAPFRASDVRAVAKALNQADCCVEAIVGQDLSTTPIFVETSKKASFAVPTWSNTSPKPS